MRGILASGLLLQPLGIWHRSIHVSFAFAEQGILLPSYTRYVNTVTLPMVIVSFAPLLPGFRRAPDKPFSFAWNHPLRPSASLFLLGILLLYFIERPHIELVLRPSPPMGLRQQLESQFKVVQAITGKSPIWICLPNGDRERFAEHVLKFLATPAVARVQRAASSCRDSLHSAPWPPADSSIYGFLRRCSSIAMYRPSRPIDSPAGALFRVLVDTQGRIKLEPVILEIGK